MIRQRRTARSCSTVMLRLIRRLERKCREDKSGSPSPFQEDWEGRRGETTTNPGLTPHCFLGQTFGSVAPAYVSVSKTSLVQPLLVARWYHSPRCLKHPSFKELYFDRKIAIRISVRQIYLVLRLLGRADNTLNPAPKLVLTSIRYPHIQHIHPDDSNLS